jgi:hypothetical protein
MPRETSVIILGYPRRFAMAQCAHCNTETDLYEGGIPICLACCDKKDAGSGKVRGVSADRDNATRPMDGEAGTRSPHSDNNQEA